ncbi:MAG: F0F1 ATP synthase subunit epsilon [Bacillota bacterium]|nr:F0F1 ATP synthase subunit epsilon [Bacillota bacterium]
MAAKLKLSILTPEKEFFIGEVTEVNTETTEGKIGILANRSPLVALIKPTSTSFKEENGTTKKVFTSTGVVSVDNNEVRMLCDAAEWPEDIDVRRAEEAKKRAEQKLSKQDSSVDMRRAELALQRAIARIKTK